MLWKDIKEGFKEYMNDYRMLLVEGRKNDLTLHNIDNVDLFNLLKILLNSSRSASEIRGRAIG